jgi:hypothetical protein
LSTAKLNNCTSLSSQIYFWLLRIWFNSWR